MIVYIDSIDMQILHTNIAYIIPQGTIMYISVLHMYSDDNDSQLLHTYCTRSGYQGVDDRSVLSGLACSAPVAAYLPPHNVCVAYPWIFTYKLYLQMQ